MAEPTGFEPAISCVTGRHVNPYTTVPSHKVKQLRGQDLNLRPSGYEPDELPSCSTPRQSVLAIFDFVTKVFMVEAEGLEPPTLCL